MDALYTRFPDALLFVDELQPPSEFAEIPVNSTPPQANETGQSQPNRTLWKTAESYVGQQPEQSPPPQASEILDGLRRIRQTESYGKLPNPVENSNPNN